jgi:hypothetical protein
MVDFGVLNFFGPGANFLFFFALFYNVEKLPQRKILVRNFFFIFFLFFVNTPKTAAAGGASAALSASLSDASTVRRWFVAPLTMPSGTDFNCVFHFVKFLQKVNSTCFSYLGKQHILSKNT